MAVPLESRALEVLNIAFRSLLFTMSPFCELTSPMIRST